MKPVINPKKLEEELKRIADLINFMGGDAHITIADHGDWQEFKLEGEFSKKNPSVWDMIVGATH